MKENARNRNQWNQRRGGRLDGERDVAEKRHSAENLIHLKLGERHRGDKPATLRDKRKQEHQRDQMIRAHGFGSSL